MDRLRIAAAARGWGETALYWSKRIVFPETCAGCGLSGTWMCSYCAEDLVPWEPAVLVISIPDPRQGAGHVDFRIAAAYQFGGPARRAVHLLKYHGQSARAEWCAAEIARRFPTLASTETVLVPVPLFPSRQRRRRFNQSAKIAWHLSNLWDCQFADVLIRVRETRPQVELSGRARLDNVRGAFEAVERLDQRSFILVDDVVTTGATLRECALTCLSAGASSVAAVVLAASNGEAPSSI